MNHRSDGSRTLGYKEKIPPALGKFFMHKKSPNTINARAFDERDLLYHILPIFQNRLSYRLRHRPELSPYTATKTVTVIIV